MEEDCEVQVGRTLMNGLDYDKFWCANLRKVRAVPLFFFFQKLEIEKCHRSLSSARKNVNTSALEAHYDLWSKIDLDDSPSSMLLKSEKFNLKIFDKNIFAMMTYLTLAKTMYAHLQSLDESCSFWKRADRRRFRHHFSSVSSLSFFLRSEFRFRTSDLTEVICSTDGLLCCDI